MYSVHTGAVQYLLYNIERTLLLKSVDAPELSDKCRLN